MASEMSPAMYAAHVGIPVSTVEAWLQGNGSVLVDPRDLRPITGRLVLIAVQAPNASGQGARPRFIPNPAYKYTRKRKGLIHESSRTSPMEVVPVEGAGVGGMPQPAPEDVEGDIPFRVVGGESMAQGLQIAGGEAGTLHG